MNIVKTKKLKKRMKEKNIKEKDKKKEKMKWYDTYLSGFACTDFVYFGCLRF